LKGQQLHQVLEQFEDEGSGKRGGTSRSGLEVLLDSGITDLQGKKKGSLKKKKNYWGGGGIKGFKETAKEGQKNPAMTSRTGN